MGKPVTGFLPLKAPIDLAAHQDDADEEFEFNVSMFMERQAADGHLIGLVVDLTTPQPDGTKLYDTEEWSRDWDVEYVSLPCTPPLSEKAWDGESAPWVEPVPSEEAVNKFIATVGRFWSQPQNQRRHVAVHCVTGINVSGAMIARFLMRNANVGPVLAAFARSRPPGIYSPDILEAIWRAKLADTPMPGGKKTTDGGWVQPQPPKWHPLPYRAIDRTSAAGASAPTSTSSSSAQAAMPPPTMPPPAMPPPAMPPPAMPPPTMPPPAASAAAAKPAVPAFADPPAPSAGKRAAPEQNQMPPPKRAAVDSGASKATVAAGVEEGAVAMRSVGTRVDAAEAAVLRTQCDALIGLPASSADQLPGYTHGAPLLHPHLEAMKASVDGWLVTWKAEGARCLLMVGGAAGGIAGVSYLFDGDGGVYKLPPMAWPRANLPMGSPGPMVLAGEIVSDSDGASAAPVWRMLCYDLLALDGRPLSAMPLSKRMALIGAEVLNPRKAPAHASAVAAEKLRVRQKDCFRLKHVPHLLTKFIPKLSHPAKGLVFVASDAKLSADGASTRAYDWYSSRGGADDAGAVAQGELVAFAEAHFK